MKKIKPYKPNLILRIIYKLGIVKDPRFNGKKLSWIHFDELLLWQTPKKQKSKLSIFIKKHLG